MIKFVLIYSLFYFNFQLITENSYTYNLKFEDELNNVFITNQTFECWFNPLVLDTITSTSIVSISKVKSKAKISFNHEFIKDTFEFNIINYKFIEVCGRIYRIDSNLVPHFSDIMPKYYFDSLTINTKSND